MEGMGLNQFWEGKRVLVTGHTGFKGSWLNLLLLRLGAQVYGYSLAPEDSLFEHLHLENEIDHHLGDIRDSVSFSSYFNAVKPDIVLHLAAQPLVRLSYAQPIETWQTNVMGSANILEAARHSDRVCAVVMITTDKVYHNHGWVHSYRENDPLGGRDPYSSSKAAAEILIASWRHSFFNEGHPVRIASARAGNVIGGGDYAKDRILPDLVRALQHGQELVVRNPSAVRPWQHVLDPLWGYLNLAQHLYQSADPKFQDSFNFGPQLDSFVPVSDLVQQAIKTWPGKWNHHIEGEVLHEEKFLTLSTDKAHHLLGWTPKWNFKTSVDQTMRWYKSFYEKTPAAELCEEQISQFLRL